jgi:hypothetical protein
MMEIRIGKIRFPLGSSAHLHPKERLQQYRKFPNYKQRQRQQHSPANHEFSNLVVVMETGAFDLRMRILTG